MFKYLRDGYDEFYAVMSLATWFALVLAPFLLATVIFSRAKELEDNNVLKFMAENGYVQKWEPNSQQLIWTKEVK